MELKINTASNILKILLIIFAIGVIFLGFYVLPTLAEEMVYIYPELEYAKSPILLICEVLLLLLLSGIGIIMKLLIIFDRGLTFSLRFTKGLEILVGMCIVASIGIVVLLQYMHTFGGPGPLLGLIMVGLTFIIWILASTISLIRAIVKNAIAYKDDFDLTV